ncbi:vicilin-like seed storage protein At2g18540 isoform X2 [Cynara cardunculus var. scolymus]|uniref:vicilin-like seed storage protein At2g18540 isoform X2 n=1 Tax=Cynara cardunculus var. scolymus TaxID=59895 RepID=UPI000D62301B|nr:vicilin-like seed storage protein At2g18540 isoform X2 [Cynara cardunculus var. scolymus]
MKNSARISKGNANNGGSNQNFNRLAPVNNSKMKNRNRMGGGGGGLSLQAFANAKTKTDGYNPALIKKQREFYKNAKYVNKYKKSLKQQNQEQGSSQATKSVEDRNENKEVGERHRGKRQTGNKSAYSLKEIYEKKREEEEKARMEKEAIIDAKKRKKEESEGRRKAQREKMLKRTRSGQPIMKYRIEHLLQTIQGSND